MRKLARYKHATLLLQQLNNELSDLRLIVGKIEDVCQQASNQSSGLVSDKEALSRAIDGGKKTILGLESLITYGLLMPSEGADSKIDRLFWIRKESELRDKVSELRNAKSNISLAIGNVRFSKESVCLLNVLYRDVLEAIANKHPSTPGSITSW